MRSPWFFLVLVAILVTPACDKATPVAPTGASITLSASPERIEKVGQTTIAALLRKSDGSRVNPGTEVTFTTTLGVLAENVVPTDDGGVALTTLRGDGRVGTATVVANSGGASEASVDVAIGSFAFSVTLVATPGTISRSGGGVDLLATVRDDFGQLVSGIAVTFDSELGVLNSRGSPVLSNNLGEARDRLAVSGSDITVLVTSSFVVSALAATEGGSLIEATATIQIEGGAGSIVLQATPSTIPDAGGTSELLAVVRANNGEPQAGEGVTFSTDVGSLASGGSIVVTNSLGEARDTLTVTEQDLNAVSTGFSVGAQTTGSAGAQLQATATVSVSGRPPIADFTFITSLGGCLVSFDGTVSSGTAPLTYSWSFGDGGTAVGGTTSHTYVCTGIESFVVTLSVTNAFGNDVVQKNVTPQP
ncbi:MAG: PKD domain-containing protein [Thermoanaerobaculia bacterium]